MYKCNDSLIKVNGKINAIVLDSCSKTACVFEEAMATVEVVNSKDIQIQCTKTAPAMTIDGCVAVTYYMPSTFAQSQIITAKSAAVNLIRPTDDDDVCFHQHCFPTYLTLLPTQWHFLYWSNLFPPIHVLVAETPDRRDANPRTIHDHLEGWIMGHRGR